MLSNCFNISCKKYGYLLPIQPYCIVHEFHFQTNIVVWLVDYDAVIINCHISKIHIFGASRMAQNTDSQRVTAEGMPFRGELGLFHAVNMG